MSVPRPLVSLVLAASCFGLAACSGPEAPPEVEEGALSERQRAAIEQLEAIGYLGSTDRDLVGGGVTVDRRAATQPGLNLWASGHAPVALLTDMDGAVLHRWEWTPPEGELDRYLRRERFHWRRVELLEDGELLAIFEGRSLLKLDRDSNLLWAYFGNPHHDLEVLPSGEILVLTRAARLWPELDPEEPILEDFLTWLGPDGEERRRVSLIECFERSEFGRFWGRSQGDLLHTNSLEVLDGALAERAPAFRSGNVLLSMRSPSALAVVDPERGEAVWLHRGEFRFQHDAEVLANGRLLLFDNGRNARRGSRIVEIDPATRRESWEYRGSESAPFFSEWRGSSQRLANGNTLIAESDQGRALEVTAEGEIVWEFLNPYPGRDDPTKRASIGHMERLPRDRDALRWLARPSRR